MIDHNAGDRNAGLKSNGIDDLKLFRRAVFESERGRDEAGISLLYRDDMKLRTLAID
jgi:hypothetical protein